MADFFDYIDWRGDIPFSQVPFNKIDALLLAHLTYNIFDGVVSKSFDERKNFTQVVKDFKEAPDYEARVNIGFLINKRTVELMLKSAGCLRYKDIELCGFWNCYDEEKTEQFAAITYIVNGQPLIVFRGTDDTIAGWREDFNIAWLDEIPAQKDALKYFKAAAKAFDGKMIIAGHSKGGNLAINTAVKCGNELQKRIETVYNFDGPGFSKDFYDMSEYKAVEKKISSFYPGCSVVGMIFHHPKKFEIVRSEGFTLWQHDAMNWQIMGGGFINEKKFTDESRLFYKAFNDWIDKLNKRQKKNFVETLFGILEASGAKTNNDIEKDPLKASAKMLAAYAEMDKNRRKELRTILSMFKDVITDDFPIFKPLALIKNSRSVQK